MFLVRSSDGNMYLPDSWYESPFLNEEEEGRSWMTEEEEKEYEEWLDSYILKEKYHD